MKKNYLLGLFVFVLMFSFGFGALKVKKAEATLLGFLCSVVNFGCGGSMTSPCSGCGWASSANVPTPVDPYYNSVLLLTQAFSDVNIKALKDLIGPMIMVSQLNVSVPKGDGLVFTREGNKGTFFSVDRNYKSKAVIIPFSVIK